MSVTVDHLLISSEELGLRTLGDVLDHLRSGDRFVVQILVDGEEPDLADMDGVRAIEVEGRSIFVETGDPMELAAEALDQVHEQLDEAEGLKAEAAELLQRGQSAAAMGPLGACFSTWIAAHESILQTSRVMNLNLAEVRVGERAVADVLGEFAGQLRQIKAALEARDFVLLSDILSYETAETTGLWKAAVRNVREALLPA